MYGMNTSLVYCRKFLQFIGTSMLIIAAPSNMFVLTFGRLFVLVKSSRRMHPVILDFPFAGRRLPCSDRERDDDLGIRD